MDRTALYLEKAREKALSEDVEVEWVQSDMREFIRPDSFDLVVSMFTSFGYFETDEEHQGVLDEIARVLAPGGAALLDLMDLETVRLNLVRQSVDHVNEAVVETERAMSEDGKRVEKFIRLIRTDLPAKDWRESVRLFTAAEVEAMARRARLDVETVVGDYDGRPHRSGETRRLVVLRKAR